MIKVPIEGEKVLYAVREEKTSKKWFDDEYRQIDLTVDEFGVNLFVAHESYFGDYTAFPLRLKKSAIKGLIKGLQQALKEIDHDA